MRTVLALLLLALPLSAQQHNGVVVTEKRTPTATLYTLKNDRAAPLEAFVASIHFFGPRNSVPPDEFIVKDHIATNGRDPALQADETWNFPPLPPAEGPLHTSVWICAAVFRNGLALGTDSCLEKIFAPRRALLAGARQALETLENSTPFPPSRLDLLHRLAEVKDPLPPIAALRQTIQATTDDNYGLIVRNSLEQLKARVELLANSRPALD